MSFRIESNFDPRKIETRIKGHVNDGLSRYATRLQAALDGVHERMAGRPVEEVKPALLTTWQAATTDGNITDPELTTFAQAISDGRRVVLDTTRFHV